MRPRGRTAAFVAAAALVAAWAGACSALSGLDDFELDPGAAGGSGGAGNGGAGGSAVTPCGDRSDCPADGPCVAYGCSEGRCTPSFAPEGFEAAGSVQGDCKRVLCSATGMPTEQVDDGDTPPDQDCQLGSCQQGAPVLTPKENGTPCGAQGDLECVGGTCVGCNDAADCLAGVCEDPVCNAMSRCSTTPKGAGVEVSDANSSDCVHDVCDGAGSVMTAADPLDNPNDGEDCTTDACYGTIPTHLPASNGAACNSGGGQFCLGGVCSECAVSANCPSPPPNQCITGFTCTAQGTCAPILAMDGTSCGGGNHCLAGVCVECLTTPDCPAPSPCHTVACVNNACVEGQAGNGTSCGQNQVCCVGTCCNLNETCSMGLCQQ
jgi:hypothetical protein